MSEKRNIEVVVGIPGRGEGEGKKDWSAPPKDAEVSGRYSRWAWVTCPHCGAFRHIIEDTDYTQWYTCGNCGHDYRY